jgi:hypothetical protein
MQKGVVFDQKPERVLDLGTGYSNVHLNIEEITVSDMDENQEPENVVKYRADVVRVKNPATEEAILGQVKGEVIEFIRMWDSSEAVNELTINGEKIWIPRELRAALKMRLEAEKAAGIVNTKLWYNNQHFELTVELALQMLAQLELYAAESYDVTASHISAVFALTSADEIVNYNYHVGYPQKLSF